MLSKISFSLLGFSLLFFSLQAQVEAQLTIANEHVDSGNYHFDLYLHTPPSSSGDLYLGHADFRIFFDQNRFNSPSLHVVSGYCTLSPIDPGPGKLNELLLRLNYTNNLGTLIQFGNELVINLFGPFPQNINAFRTLVAEIKGAPNTYRLGRFRISGYQGGPAMLSWNFNGQLSTKVFTISDDDVGPPPFESLPVILNQSNLPVSLLSFQAKRYTERTVMLQWKTSREQNSDYFEVERKTANGGFSSIGRVAAAGNSEEVLEYQLWDRMPLTGPNHYRLKQVDQNGTLSFSEQLLIYFDPEEQLSLYPNPARSEIYVLTSPSFSGEVELRLYNSIGQEMFFSGWKKDREARTQFSIKGLSPGMYLYRLEAGSAFRTGKLLVAD